MFNIDLAKYRVVDLSVMVVPGQEKRRMEIRRKTIEADDTYMFEIDTMSHIGTHVEAPSHFVAEWKDVTDLDVTHYMGRAAVVDIDFPDYHQPITPAVFEAAIGDVIGETEVVLLRNLARKRPEPSVPAERHYLTLEAAKWLVDKKVKMFGFDTSFCTGDGKGAAREAHDVLLSKDVLLIEVLGNMNELRKKQCYFIALPLKIKGLDSSPVRAIAIEER
ncbi:MAG: cyclase family protein [Firmicutes bacterium]|nr:cyclase family protein [Bacillota bacterium]